MSEITFESFSPAQRRSLAEHGIDLRKQLKVAKASRERAARERDLLESHPLVSVLGETMSSAQLAALETDDLVERAARVTQAGALASRGLAARVNASPVNAIVRAVETAAGSRSPELIAEAANDDLSSSIAERAQAARRAIFG